MENESLINEVIQEVWNNVPLNCHCNHCECDLNPEEVMLDRVKQRSDWEYMARNVVKIVAKKLCQEISYQYSDMDEIKIHKL